MTPWNPQEPYNSLPTLPPAADLETTAILKACTRARVQLAALNEAAKRLPNPAILINSISLDEARASSEIENIFTTRDELYAHANNPSKASPETRETLHYRTALFTGMSYMQQRALDINAMVRICTELLDHQVDVRSMPGTRIANAASREVIYSPPEGKAVITSHLTSMISYLHAALHADEIDPLVIMALCHYQFEAIHPFYDGNGRTGRIINILVLIEAGLIDSPVLFLSGYIMNTKTEYYRLLHDVTSVGAWSDWILYMLEGVRSAAKSTLDTLNRIDAAYAQAKTLISNTLPGGGNIDLLDCLFLQPYCRTSDIEQNCHVSRPTASKWLKALAVTGLLEQRSMGREIVFINRGLIAALANSTWAHERDV